MDMKLYGNLVFGSSSVCKFPLGPSIVVLGHSKAKRCAWLRFRKSLVAPFASEKARQKSMIRLPNHQQLRTAFVFFFDQNHGAALNL
jgi:hypothetical protein